ncbi:Conserved_hypothetical protein [Hexamita inflata]|uniref:Uncharacterized protein n=1 Tax=Hexamita inflata TaxID=28002 RepID=A0AA86PV67_9EUKA|nr:Conserved hypothetical protein [Hexamita inflata]CAI9941975.1 Conserved hypothetical protein [Hexamita inflata]
MKKDEEGNLTNVIEVIYDDNSVENYAINSGIVYLMVPLCEDLPPLLLFFQLHETGHASADTMNNLLAMKKQLSDNYFPCEGFAKDSDKYWAQHTTSAFEHISNNFYEKQNIDIYRLLSGVEHHLDIQDLLHLSKRIHYRHIKKPIKLQFKLDGLEYDFKKLKDIFNINPQCFQDKPNLKMIDDITLHFYSVKNIQILLERRNVDELFLVMIYFVLVYPLSTVFVKVNDLVFQQMVALSLVTLLRLVSLSTNIKAETVWADDLRNLGENNAKNITHLTFSDQIWMKEAIVSLAQILRLVKKYDTVFIVAVGSYMCENYFSVLRFLSHGNNSASKAEEIIVNKEVLDYCCYETGQDISGTKRSRSKTLVVRKSRILNSEELQYIDRISWAMIRVIDEDTCTNDEIRKLPGRNLKDMICEFVSSIYNENIITENFWHTNEERLYMSKIIEMQLAKVVQLLQFKIVGKLIWSERGNLIYFSITLLYNIDKYIIQSLDNSCITSKQNLQSIQFCLLSSCDYSQLISIPQNKLNETTTIYDIYSILQTNNICNTTVQINSLFLQQVSYRQKDTYIDILSVQKQLADLSHNFEQKKRKIFNATIHLVAQINQIAEYFLSTVIQQ